MELAAPLGRAAIVTHIVVERALPVALDLAARDDDVGILEAGHVAAEIAEAAEHAGLEKSAAVRSTSEAAELLSEIAAPGDLVLIKGSRAARTEEVIEQFRLRHSSLGISV